MGEKLRPGEIEGPMAPANESTAFDTQLSDGVPLVEAATKIRVGPCSQCGKLPEDSEGGMLDHVRVVDGVMMGVATCAECMNAFGDFRLDDWDE